jgi:hypothetical protein
MNCFKLIFLCISCCIFLGGCKGTGILMMPSQGDAINKKFKCSSAFLNGYWLGTYEKSKIEIDIKQDDKKGASSSIAICIYDKDKKQPLIPAKIIVFQVKKGKYILFVADIGEIVKRGGYNPMSNGFLYPVMKIFKIVPLKKNKLSFKEVIFTQKVEKDKIVKLDPGMKMWGDNSNTIYGTSTEIISYLQKDKYRLSPKTILTKRSKAMKK